jgi:hypothetical protein
MELEMELELLKVIFVLRKPLEMPYHPLGGVDTMFVTSKKLPVYNVISVGLAITVTVVVVNVIVVPVVRPESTIVEVVPTIALLKFMFVVLR